MHGIINLWRGGRSLHIHSDDPQPLWEPGGPLRRTTVDGGPFRWATLEVKILSIVRVNVKVCLRIHFRLSGKSQKTWRTFLPIIDGYNFLQRDQEGRHGPRRPRGCRCRPASCSTLPWRPRSAGRPPARAPSATGPLRGGGRGGVHVTCDIVTELVTLNL